MRTVETPEIDHRATHGIGIEHCHLLNTLSSNVKPIGKLDVQFCRCLMLTSSISNIRVPNVEPSPLARRVGLKMVVNNLCLSKNCKS